MDQPERLSLPDASKTQDIIAEMSNAFSLSEERGQRATQTFSDTFDWRLYHEGLCLVRQKGEYVLWSLSEDQATCSQPWTSRSRPRFWWDFDDGPVRERVSAVSGVRAFIPLVTLERRRRTLAVLNRDEKTVARLHFDSPILRDGQRRSTLPGTVTVHPIRGYRAHPREAVRFLAGLGLESGTGGVLEAALHASGRFPGDYSPKFDLGLDPRLGAQQAAATILKHLVGVILQNEQGLKADIDTEFLHDFRVSIRRTRSALTQLKEVFPADIVARFRRSFASLGKLTNRLRDLDVYLLAEHNYRKMVPEAIGAGLDPLFEGLRRERKREFQRLSKALAEPDYRNTIDGWRRFLDRALEGGVEVARNSNRPAIDLACKSIRKRHRKVIAIGKEIDGSTPEAELHRLRIECKKLRYSLEFFASLFPPDDVKLAVTQLKKLQDNLGDFNDLRIQQDQLSGYLETLDAGRPGSLVTAAAVGGLVAVLYQKLWHERRAFSRTFDSFAAPEFLDLFQRLFGKGSRATGAPGSGSVDLRAIPPPHGSR